MNHMKVKLLVAGLLLAGAVGYLAISAAGSGLVTYREVDEVLGDAGFQQRRVRIAGTVVEQGVEVEPVRMYARFELVGTQRNLPVEYKGTVPENFAPGGNVVVEGKLDEQNVFHADVMLTKCASKYEADHAERLGDEP